MRVILREWNSKLQAFTLNYIREIPSERIAMTVAPRMLLAAGNAVAGSLNGHLFLPARGR